MPNPGDKQINKRTGEMRVFDGHGWVMQPPPKGAQGEASMRGRLNMGMGPMVQAEQDLLASEQGGGGQRVNPLNRDVGPALLDAIPDWAFGSATDALAKKWGGQDYQDYATAARQFEAQLMPIMSGAAVSPSEARRQIRANLPQLGDSPATLEKKARGRKMMLNGAAKVMGAALPYPDVPTYGVNTQNAPAANNSPQIVKPPANKGYRVISVE